MKNIAFHLLCLLFFAAGCAPETPHAPPPGAAPPKIWTESERRFLLVELDRTTAEVLKETEDLGEEQWHFHEDNFRWSIAAIIEHLTVQNELDYRELTSLANAPAMPQYLMAAAGQDQLFRAYATDPEKAQAKWFLQPIGRFGHKRQAVDAFLRARDGLRDFVEATEVDLRLHFTFRNKAGEKPMPELKPGDVRDLHQLVLYGIAHTDRHLRQIRNIKKHSRYPKDM